MSDCNLTDGSYDCRECASYDTERIKLIKQLASEKAKVEKLKHEISHALLYLESTGLTDESSPEYKMMISFRKTLNDLNQEQQRASMNEEGLINAAEDFQKSYKINLAISALKKCHLKHNQGSDAIGWSELGDVIHNTLAELMGDDKYVKWLGTLEHKGDEG